MWKYLFLLCVTATILSNQALAGTTAFVCDFESGLPTGFSGGSLESTGGYSSYHCDDYFLWSDGSTITLTLTGLESHNSIDLDFLFAAIDSWDPLDTSLGPDYFNVAIDGVEVFEAVEVIQTNNGTEIFEEVVPTGNPSQQINTISLLVNNEYLHGNSFWTDSAYNVSLNNIAHTSDTLTVTWWADGPSWQGLTDNMDESFAIDNISVALNSPVVPVPSSILLCGLGIGLGRCVQRRK